MQSKTLSYKSLILILSIFLAFSITDAIDNKRTVEKRTQAQMQNEKDKQLASRLVDYYYRQKNPVRFQTIDETLKHIRLNLSTHLDGTPYTEQDLVALVMIESSFNQYAVGPKKEKGLFQITKMAAEALGVKQNEFDIAVNTEMAARTLRDKYNTYRDYKKGLIAYNGVVPTKDGWQLTYWKRFSQARKTVELIYKDVENNP